LDIDGGAWRPRSVVDDVLVQVFTCGPLPFMRHVRSTLLDKGVPPSHIRYEVFGPDLWAAQVATG